MFKLSYMKIVTQNAVSCFRNGGNAKFNNTEVVTENGVSKMYLFGNLIATLEHNVGGVMKITNAGWDSNTTKERLNGLPNVNIQQKNFVWYLNGVEWNGAWKQIN
jgi:hypothetical protein